MYKYVYTSACMLVNISIGESNSTGTFCGHRPSTAVGTCMMFRPLLLDLSSESGHVSADVFSERKISVCVWGEGGGRGGCLQIMLERK